MNDIFYKMQGIFFFTCIFIFFIFPMLACLFFGIDYFFAKEYYDEFTIINKNINTNHIRPMHDKYNIYVKSDNNNLCSFFNKSKIETKPSLYFKYNIGAFEYFNYKKGFLTGCMYLLDEDDYYYLCDRP